MKVVKAKFIGVDSLGYVRNQIYTLYIWETHLGFLDWLFGRRNYIQISREDRTGLCPYSSVVTFLDNWKIL